MRVEIRTQKGVPAASALGETRTQTHLNVVLASRGQEVVIATFATPGSFTEGFLSEHQAKVRARETADRMKEFLQAQGELEGEAEAPAAKASSRRQEPKVVHEPRTFLRAG